MKIKQCSWPPSASISNTFLSAFNNMLDRGGIDTVDVFHLGEIDKGSCDIVTIHWPEQIYWTSKSPIKIILATIKTVAHLVRLKISGIKLVWVVHNLEPHGDIPQLSKAISKYYYQIIARLTDAFVTLSPGTVEVVRENFRFKSTVKSLGLRHPPYPPPAQDERSAIRSALKIANDQFLVGLVGTIRTYKGAIDLISAFRSASVDGAHLIIAGKVEDASIVQFIGNGGAEQNITIVDKALSHNEYENFILACDAIALPFVKTLHSGSIIHALSLSKPVITPSTPFSEDLAEAYGANWVKIYKGKLTGDTLREAMTSPECGKIDPAINSEEASILSLSAFYYSMV